MSDLVLSRQARLVLCLVPVYVVPCLPYLCLYWFLPVCPRHPPSPSPHSARPNYPRVFLLWLTPLVSWQPLEIFRTSCVQFGRKQLMTPVSGGSWGTKTVFFQGHWMSFFPQRSWGKSWKHSISKECKRTNTTYTSAALVWHKNLCVLPAVAYFHTAGYLCPRAKVSTLYYFWEATLFVQDMQLHWLDGSHCI